jgi:hypothetical protein
VPAQLTGTLRRANRIALGGLGAAVAIFLVCAFSVCKCVSYRTADFGLLLTDGGLWYYPTNAISCGPTLLDQSWGRGLGWHVGVRDEYRPRCFWPLMPAMAPLRSLTPEMSPMPSRGHIVLLPLGSLSLLLGSLSFVALRILKRNAYARGHCSSCGYDLRASTVRCPECGTPIPGGDASRSSKDVPALRVDRSGAGGLRSLALALIAQSYVLLCRMAEHEPQSPAAVLGLVFLVTCVLAWSLLASSASVRRGGTIVPAAVLCCVLMLWGGWYGTYLFFLARLTGAADERLLCLAELVLFAVALVVLCLLLRSRAQRSGARVV